MAALGAIVAAPAFKACTSVGCFCLRCFNLIEKIRDWVRVAKENDEVCESILSNAEAIRKNLCALAKAKLIECVENAINNLEGKLKKCEEYIDSLKDRFLSRIRDFIDSKKIQNDLERLKTAMHEAVPILNQSVGIQLLLEKQGVETSATLQPHCKCKIPSRPLEPAISKRAEKRVLMTWKESKEHSSAVKFYQVEYRKRWQKKMD